jgi:hypothetical protein
MACSLDAGQIEGREKRWRRVAEGALITYGRSGDAARQRYRFSLEVERELKELIRLEAECCPFLDFQLHREADELVLEVKGPREAEPLVELFASGA